MTAGNLAWWHAMVGAGQFEDGSLVIQDDTLDVDGGSTVNLLVKLGAKPRSDVTVALSETSTLISLGSTSLTFTPDNWDTFQSVVVTAAGGNSQTLSIASGRYTYNEVAASVGWFWNSLQLSPRFLIDSSLRGAATRYFSGVTVWRTGDASAGQINLTFAQSGTGADTANQDISDAFETSGSVTLAVGSDSVTAALAGADTSEPYVWTPSNASDVASWADTVAALTGTPTLSLTLRDYAVGDAVISLAASGPSEYSGVTGSATISVN